MGCCAPLCKSERERLFEKQLLINIETEVIPELNQKENKKDISVSDMTFECKKSFHLNIFHVVTAMIMTGFCTIFAAKIERL